MTAKMKQWVSLTVVGVIVVLVAGWFLLVSPKRSEAADVRSQVAAQESINSGLITQLSVLKAQAKTLPAQQAKLALVAAKIPDNPALPSLIRALSAAADDAGVELVAIAPGAPTAVEPTSTAGAKPAVKSTGAGTKTATGARSLTAASASSAASAGLLTAIPVTLNVVGGYFQIEQFFDGLENLSRAAKVTGLTMAPGTNPVLPPSQDGAPVGPSVESGKVLQATVTANVYMAVGRGATATAPVVPVK